MSSLSLTNSLLRINKAYVRWFYFIEVLQIHDMETFMLLVFLCSKHSFLQNSCVFQSSILHLYSFLIPVFSLVPVFCIPPFQTDPKVKGLFKQRIFKRHNMKNIGLELHETWKIQGNLVWELLLSCAWIFWNFQATILYNQLV